MKVVITSPAVRELDQIARYIERDDPNAAERFVLGIRSDCLALSDYPDRGSIVAIKRGIEIRRLGHRPYLILYSALGGSIRVHRIVHGARAPRSILKGLDLS